jgi:hypothetical protein
MIYSSGMGLDRIKEHDMTFDRMTALRELAHYHREKRAILSRIAETGSRSLAQTDQLAMVERRISIFRAFLYA